MIWACLILIFDFREWFFFLNLTGVNCFSFLQITILSRAKVISIMSVCLVTAKAPCFHSCVTAALSWMNRKSCSDEKRDSKETRDHKFTSCWIPNGRRGSPWGYKLMSHFVPLHLTYSKHRLPHKRHSCSKGCVPPGWELNHLPDSLPRHPRLSRRKPFEFF